MKGIIFQLIIIGLVLAVLVGITIDDRRSRRLRKAADLRKAEAGKQTKKSQSGDDPF